MSDLGSAVAAWMAADPDPSTRAELVQLLDDPASAAETELEDRFAGRLSFGTAGLRGVMGAGPNRMNRLVVRAATEALASYLEAHLDGARQAGVVIGADARHHSADFAEEAASVLARSGFVVRLLPLPCPTPLLAFAVRHLSAAAGVMITASHNPPQYNGYKLYLGDGAQIVPPVDAEIEALIEEEARRPPAGRDDPGGSDDNASTAASGVRAAGVERLGDEVLNAYLDALGARFRAPEAARSLRIVYTPLHGVAGRVFSAALEQAGFAAPIVVAAQAEPDPDFPTVAFPNPEEPGALDLAIAEAEACKADLVVANDPDGDRMAIAVPDEGSPRGWRPLTGDEVGSLLGSYLLDATAPDATAPDATAPDATAPDATAPDRLVATTIVSSSLLGKLAAEAGARYTE
ncbi:MAG: phospho-sugar mutase, partial [Acidimicrobiales bacterium]